MAKPGREVFLAAYDQYADAIYRHCYFRTFDRERARDLVQETFMKTWEYMADGKEIQHIRAFLYRVATNLLIDHSRKRKAVSLDALQEEGFDPGEDRRDREHGTIDGRLAVEVLESVDQKYREPILLRYIEGLTPKEIAEIIGETENVVSVRIHRGLKQLRGKFQESEDAIALRDSVGDTA